MSTPRSMGAFAQDACCVRHPGKGRYFQGRPKGVLSNASSTGSRQGASRIRRALVSLAFANAPRNVHWTAAGKPVGAPPWHGRHTRTQRAHTDGLQKRLHPSVNLPISERSSACRRGIGPVPTQQSDSRVSCPPDAYRATSLVVASGGRSLVSLSHDPPLLPLSASDPHSCARRPPVFLQ